MNDGTSIFRNNNNIMQRSLSLHRVISELNEGTHQPDDVPKKRRSADLETLYQALTAKKSSRLHATRQSDSATGGSVAKTNRTRNTGSPRLY
ncbi:hypothetical protein KCP76_06905 [Salmonella enterica subsp. enterica serovar Weltevreden]|nr:hypothetical protein KCP76_06905 [Salmonella enterica subsp. enterica serovar Weltevreden]